MHKILFAGIAIGAALTQHAFAANGGVNGTPLPVWRPPKRASHHSIIRSMNPHAYAMMHLAIHDALNAIDRKYQPYAYDQKADPGTSPDAAVAAAAHDVLVPLIKQLPADIARSRMHGCWRRSRRSCLHGGSRQGP